MTLVKLFALRFSFSVCEMGITHLMGLMRRFARLLRVGCWDEGLAHSKCSRKWWPLWRQHRVGAVCWQDFKGTSHNPTATKS